MADQESELIRDIAETRDHLERNLETLETRLRRSVDVRDRIRRRPWIAVSGALAVGFTVGALRRSKRSAAGGGLLREISLIVISGLVRDLIHAAAPEMAAHLGRRVRAASAPGRRAATPSFESPLQSEGSTAPFERTRDASAGRFVQHDAR